MYIYLKEKRGNFFGYFWMPILSLFRRISISSNGVNDHPQFFGDCTSILPSVGTDTRTTRERNFLVHAHVRSRTVVHNWICHIPSKWCATPERLTFLGCGRNALDYCSKSTRFGAQHRLEGTLIAITTIWRDDINSFNVASTCLPTPSVGTLSCCRRLDRIRIRMLSLRR